MLNENARVIKVVVNEFSKYDVTVKIKEEDLDNFISYLNLFKNEGIAVERANG